VAAFLSPGQSVAVFGGSFDPPHAGHRLVAENALASLELDYIWWMVSPQNPLKTATASALETRLGATRELAAHPQFHVDAIETQLGTQYAIDTVRALKARHPQVRFIWLLGADNLVDMHQWKDWQAALEAPAAIAFSDARLANEASPQLKDTPAPAWVLLEGARSPLSSTALRNQQDDA
jgi:nicotinate-nucleotide adenylyltransferase